MIKENVNREKVMKEIKEISSELYGLQEQIEEWAEGSMAESPIYEVARTENTEDEKEIARHIMKQLIDNYEEYNRQLRGI